MSRTNGPSVVKRRRRRNKGYRPKPFAKRQKQAAQVCKEAGEAIMGWQGAWLGEEQDVLPAEDDWKMQALDDVRFNKHDPDASTLDAKWQRKVEIDAKPKIVTRTEAILIGDIISCPTWGPRAHRYASPPAAATDWLLLQIDARLHPPTSGPIGELHRLLVTARFVLALLHDRGTQRDATQSTVGRAGRDGLAHVQNACAGAALQGARV